MALTPLPSGLNLWLLWCGIEQADALQLFGETGTV
jgi:hypothetical protein